MPYLGKEPARVPVTAADIPDDSITAAKIVDGAITISDIADDAVTAAKLANSINTDIATGVTANTTANAALPKTGGAMTGAITTNSTFDGRDVATDGTKLDGIEASADVTDATNVAAAGALMDSEVTNLAQVKAFDSSDYATAAQGTTADAALPKAGGTMTGNTVHGDNVKDTYGASADLEIYHDGSHSYVSDTGTGNLNLKGQNLNLLASNSNDYLRCVQGGAVELYHNNVKKLETIANGVTVTGTLGVTTVDLGNWTITESGGVLFFATGGTNKMKLDASGNLTCVGDVTANGSM